MFFHATIIIYLFQGFSRCLILITACDWSMQHFLKGRRFESFDEVVEAIKGFFDFKESEWCFDQIQNF